MSPPWLAAVAVAVVACLASPLVWVASGGGYFWPRWVWFGVGCSVLVVVLTGWIRQAPYGRRRLLVADGALLVFLVPVETTVWLLTGRGLYWPVFSIVAASILFGGHVWYVARRPDPREQELAERVDTLTRTRRGAVDSRAAELRRIERDLHDGAQARMVSTALSIGLAERLMRTDPAAAGRVLKNAKTAANAAVEDLRSVMHGIYPAVLSDRGLGGAVRALTYDLVIPVSVAGEPPTGIAPALEAAVYYATAECLANAVKHGEADTAWVTFRSETEDMIVEVGDDGVGGASLNGGTGLHGVTERLSAFDGTLDIDSPRGGPTRIVIAVPLPDAPPELRPEGPTVLFPASPSSPE